MAHLEFRPLELELERQATTLGYHDLRSQFVTLDGMNSAVTSKHEGFHDELLLHTPFGWLQHTLANVHAHLPADHTHRPLVERWISMTVNRSRTAHETYATFLTIKSFSKRDEPALLDRHPPEYRQYFWNLSKTIDFLLHSSYLQFLVGKALVTAAFASDIISRLSALDSFTAEVLPDADSPDARLTSILEQYEASFHLPILEIIRTVTAELISSGELPANFSPFSEDDWTSILGDTSGHLDERLMPALHRCVLDKCKAVLGFPVFDFTKSCVSPMQSLINLFMTDVEWRIKAEYMTEFELKRRRLGDVQIANRPVLPVNRRIESASALERLIHPHAAITESLYRAQDLIEWKLVVSAGDETRVSQVSDDLVRSALAQRCDCVADGDQDFLRCVVVGVKSLDAFEDMYTRYWDVVSRADSVATYATVFWYMGGSCVDWFDSKLFEGEAYLYTLVVSEEARDSKLFGKRSADGRFKLLAEHRNSPYLPPRMFVFRSPTRHGYFVRLLPGYESYKIAFKKSMGCSPVDERERNYLRSASTMVTCALLNTWSTI